jgi:translocation and assembly module TamB
MGSKIELEGWVGFDRSMNLTASVPILPTMLADRPILGAGAGAARVRVPIRGTLQKPEIDREAFRLGMQDMGRTLLERGAVEGAAGLLERLTRPRDPNAPPPPTAEERRERRQERRADRQLRRGRMPD